MQGILDHNMNMTLVELTEGLKLLVRIISVNIKKLNVTCKIYIAYILSGTKCYFYEYIIDFNFREQNIKY